MSDTPSEVHGQRSNLRLMIGQATAKPWFFGQSGYARFASYTHLNGATTNVLAAIHQLQRGAAKGRGSVELARGLKVFDKTLLYVTKPTGRRFWTHTAALNDADDIAGTILMRPPKEDS